MLDYIYEVGEGASEADYSPSSQQVNADVLRLVRAYELPNLLHRAAAFMGKDLTTHNVVERLAWCDEFGLQELRGKILEQLTANKQALQEVTSSPAIDNHPALMREMLALIANRGDGGKEKGAGGKQQPKVKSESSSAPAPAETP